MSFAPNINILASQIPYSETLVCKDYVKNTSVYLPKHLG